MRTFKECSLRAIRHDAEKHGELEYLAAAEEILGRMPDWQADDVMNQDLIELDCQFLGFIDEYARARDLAVRHGLRHVIDFGSYVALQCFLFDDPEHFDRYESVDTCELQRFHCCRINSAESFELIQEYVSRNGDSPYKDGILAVCIAVPDEEAMEMVSETYPNHFITYPGMPDDIVIGNKKEVSAYA